MHCDGKYGSYIEWTYLLWSGNTKGKNGCFQLLQNGEYLSSYSGIQNQLLAYRWSCFSYLSAWLNWMVDKLDTIELKRCSSVLYNEWRSCLLSRKNDWFDDKRSNWKFNEISILKEILKSIYLSKRNVSTKVSFCF